MTWVNATFRGVAAFDNTIFVKNADVELATFHQDVWFNDKAGNVEAAAVLFLPASFKGHSPFFYS